MNIEFITKDDLRRIENLLGEIKGLIKPGQGQSKQWLKSYEVRKLLKISPGTLHRWRVEGTIPYSRIGGTILYKYEDVKKLVDKARKER